MSRWEMPQQINTDSKLSDGKEKPKIQEYQIDTLLNIPSSDNYHRFVLELYKQNRDTILLAIELNYGSVEFKTVNNEFELVHTPTEFSERAIEFNKKLFETGYHGNLNDVNYSDEQIERAASFYLSQQINNNKILNLNGVPVIKLFANTGGDVSELLSSSGSIIFDGGSNHFYGIFYYELVNPTSEDMVRVLRHELTHLINHILKTEKIIWKWSINSLDELILNRLVDEFSAYFSNNDRRMDTQSFKKQVMNLSRINPGFLDEDSILKFDKIAHIWSSIFNLFSNPNFGIPDADLKLLNYIYYLVESMDDLDLTSNNSKVKFLDSLLLTEEIRFRVEQQLFEVFNEII